MLTSHDYYCRCRACKPPLVGEYADRVFAWRFGMVLIALAAVVGAIIAAVTP